MNLYFDNAATTHPKPESVYKDLCDTMRNVAASPGRGAYRQSLDASRILFSTRESVASLFNIDDASRVIFTHNATGALNLALRGLLESGDHVVTTSMEHNSVMRPLHSLQKQGVSYTVVQGSNDGFIDPAKLGKAMTSRTRIVVASHVSNVCGVIQPIEELAAIARAAGAFFLLDAAQSAGSINIDVQKFGIDLLAAPGHKGLYGPQGTGLLYVAPAVRLSPILAGGTGTDSTSLEQPYNLPDGFEAGTHNVPAIAGLKAGVDFVKNIGVENIGKHERRLVALLAESLMDNKYVTLHGYSDKTPHAGLLSFSIAGKDPSAVAFELDSRFGIAVRGGLHCASMAHKTIGTFPAGTVRLSPGWFTSDEDIAFVSDAIVQCTK